MKYNLMQKIVLQSHNQFDTFVAVTARRMGKTYLMNRLAKKYIKEGKKLLAVGSDFSQSKYSFLGKNFDIRLFDEPCTIKDFEQVYQYTYAKRTLIIGSIDISKENMSSFFKFLCEVHPSISFPYTISWYKDDIATFKNTLDETIFSSEYLCEWNK